MAEDLVAALRPINPTQYVRRVVVWCRRHVTLVDEPVERFVVPTTMIDRIRDRGRAYGDCDDVTGLVAALCDAIGLPVRLVALKPAAEEFFIHVFPEVFDGAGWMMADATADRIPPGQWERMVEEV